MSTQEIQEKLTELRKLYADPSYTERSKESLALEGRGLRLIVERRERYRKTLFDEEQAVVV